MYQLTVKIAFDRDLCISEQDLADLLEVEPDKDGNFDFSFIHETDWNESLAHALVDWLNANIALDVDDGDFEITSFGPKPNAP